MKGRIRAHPVTKFGCNTINGPEVINDYLQQYIVTPTGLTANGKELKISKETG